MCGITGALAPSLTSHESFQSVLNGMNQALSSRGPDDTGVWTDPETGIGLGHRRLSILDLSSEGHQPMHSACGRYVMTYNGEVYNYLALQHELASHAHRFRGHSDTEVMLAAIAQWGLEAAVQRFVGMFAFALWDRETNTLSLVRDRLGIKPLYYGWAGSHLVFGSELKALMAHPALECRINRDALALYFRHNYVPAPYSIFHDVWKLEPGTVLHLSHESLLREHRPSLHAQPYWSAQQVWTEGNLNRWKGDSEDAISELDRLLQEAVQSRMIADVPLGAFLSGGIDSSTVVSLMQAHSSQPVKTFSIGFSEEKFNEAPYAKAIASHLGTDHTEWIVTPQDAQQVIPQLTQFWDEPFADPSQIPTYLVAKLARQQVTVSLSGDGGDELFTGYSRYQTVAQAWQRMQHWPQSIQHWGSQLMSMLPESFWNGLGTWGPRIRWRTELWGQSNIATFYRYFLSHRKFPESLVIDSHEPFTVFDSATRVGDTSYPPLFTCDIFQQMTYLDLVSYLPDDILVKVDRASMAQSLEARVPLLDHRVVEWAARLPTAFKVRPPHNKWLLRQVLYRYVPPELVERPKKGFSVPIAAWLRHDLKGWAEDLLNSDKLRQQGYLNPVQVQDLWKAHQSGKRNTHGDLWNILMFQMWLEQWKG